MIDRVIEKHELVADLLAGNWLHLVAIEGESLYRYGHEREWHEINEMPTASLESVS